MRVVLTFRDDFLYVGIACICSGRLPEQFFDYADMYQSFHTAHSAAYELDQLIFKNGVLILS